MKLGKTIIGFRIEVVVKPDETGYHAYCPALKGLHTCGDTKKEALENAKNAAEAYLESSLKHGDPIPVGIMMQEDCEVVSHSTKKQSESRYTEDLKVACAT